MDKPATTKTVARSYLDFQPGSIVLHGDQVWVVVKAIDFDTIEAQSRKTKQIERLPRGELSPPFIEVEEDRKAGELSLVSEADWAEARRRLEIIRPLVRLVGRTRGDVKDRVKELKADKTKTSKEVKCSVASIYRWVTAYEKNLRLSSLLPKQVSELKGSTWLTPKQEAIIKDAIEAKYKKKGTRQISAVQREVKSRCDEDGVEFPGDTTVRNRILDIPGEEKTRAHYGPRTARDKYWPSVGKFPGANTPHAVWQIDHTQLRQAVLADLRTGSVGRPWITLVIDVNSTVIPGFYLTLDPPDTNSVGICLAHSILPKEQWLKDRNIDAKWPIWGHAGKGFADNAGEFRGDMLKAALLEFDEFLEWRPVKHANYGAHVESMAGTLKEFLDSELPGSSSRHLKDLQEYNPDKDAVLTLAELERYIALFILKIYHHTPKASLGKRTPMQVYEAGIFGDGKQPGIGLPILQHSERDIRLMFLPRKEVTVQQYGIRWDVNYYDDCLRSWIRAVDPKTQETRKFIVRRDRRDVSVLYFYDPDKRDYFDVSFADKSQGPMTQQELRAAKRKVDEDGGDPENDTSVFKAHAELNAMVATARTETKKALREKTRAAHAKKGAAHDQRVIRNKMPDQAPIDDGAALAAIDFSKVRSFSED